MSEITDVAALALAAEQKPMMFIAHEGREFVAVPSGYKLEQITSANKADVLMPKVVSQHVKMQSTVSLVEYVNRFKNLDTVLFADIKNDTIVAIVDYHAQPTEKAPPQTDAALAMKAQAVSTDPAARLCVHRATLALPKSLEWETWTKASGVLMSHVAFATFLEENSVDIKNPVGADVLEMCRDLQVINNVTFGGTVRDGDYTTVNFAKENDAASKGGIKLPQSIMLSIPVYFGEHSVPIMAYMRRKIDDGQLRLGIQLSRAENVRQMEFHRIVDEIMVGTNHLTTVYGTPA